MYAFTFSDRIISLMLDLNALNSLLIFKYFSNQKLLSWSRTKWKSYLTRVICKQKVTNLVYVRVNSASYPQQDEPTGGRSGVAEWGSGMSAYCTAGP